MVDSASDRRPARRGDDLAALKVRKLEEQKALANEFNHLLTRQGGLNDQARQTCKNLEYAIAIATRPGTIMYYQPPEETARIVENGDLAALTQKIAHLQHDIDQVEHDIQNARMLSANAPRPPEPSISSLAEWGMAYGESDPRTVVSGFLTNFEESPKIYGGTNHHRAFKTQATIMRKGRLTR